MLTWRYFRIEWWNKSNVYYDYFAIVFFAKWYLPIIFRYKFHKPQNQLTKREEIAKLPPGKFLGPTYDVSGYRVTTTANCTEWSLEELYGLKFNREGFYVDDTGLICYVKKHRQKIEGKNEQDMYSTFFVETYTR